MCFSYLCPKEKETSFFISQIKNKTKKQTLNAEHEVSVLSLLIISYSSGELSFHELPVPVSADISDKQNCLSR